MTEPDIKRKLKWVQTTTSQTVLGKYILVSSRLGTLFISENMRAFRPLKTTIRFSKIMSLFMMNMVIKLIQGISSDSLEALNSIQGKHLRSIIGALGGTFFSRSTFVRKHLIRLTEGLLYAIILTYWIVLCNPGVMVVLCLILLII